MPPLGSLRLFSKSAIMQTPSSCFQPVVMHISTAVGQHLYVASRIFWYYAPSESSEQSRLPDEPNK